MQLLFRWAIYHLSRGSLRRVGRMWSGTGPVRAQRGREGSIRLTPSRGRLRGRGVAEQDIGGARQRAAEVPSPISPSVPEASPPGGQLLPVLSTSTTEPSSRSSAQRPPPLAARSTPMASCWNPGKLYLWRLSLFTGLFESVVFPQAEFRFNDILAFTRAFFPDLSPESGTPKRPLTRLREACFLLTERDSKHRFLLRAAVRAVVVCATSGPGTVSRAQ